MSRLFGCIFLTSILGLATEPLSEERAIERALEQDAGLDVLQHEIRAAALAPKGIGLIASPQIRLGMRDMAPDLNDPGYARTNAGLAWAPPRIGAFGTARESAAARTSQARAQLASAKSRTAAEVRVIFRTAILLEEQSRLAEEGVRLRERILSGVREQEGAGLKTKSDTGAAELALAEARVRAGQVRSERLMQLVRLGNRTGLSPASITLEPTSAILQFDPPALDEEALRREAVEARPEIRGVRARCRLADLESSAARRDLYPWISSLQVFRRSTQINGASDWGYQVSIEVPVFRWRENDLAAARERAAGCRAALLAAESAVSAEVAELVTRMGNAARDLGAQRQELVERGAAHVESLRTMFASRQTDLVEPLEAEVRLVELKQSYVSRLMEFRALEAGLRQALGN